MSQNKSRPTLPWQKPPQAPNCVTIFGGGIAGLTAAHELVERGFNVQLWEPTADTRRPNQGCDVGGLARTQWARVHWADERPLDRFEPSSGSVEPNPGRPYVGRRAQPVVGLPQKIGFVAGEQRELRIVPLVEAEATPTEAAQSFVDALADCDGLVIKVRGWAELGPEKRDRLAQKVGQTLADYLVGPSDSSTTKVVASEDPVTEVITLRVPGVVSLDKEVQLVGAKAQDRVQGLGVIRTWRRTKTARRQADDASFELVEDWRPGSAHGLGAWGNRNVGTVLYEILDALRGNPDIQHIYVEASDRDFKFLTPAQYEMRARRIFEVLHDELRRANLADLVSFGPLEAARSVDGGTQRRFKTVATITAAGPKMPRQWQVCFEIVPLGEFPEDAPDGAHLILGFRIRERWLPGEHGYRFFPAFYRHVFDTMKRIPLFQTVAKSEFTQEQERAADISAPEPVHYIESGQTVFDNLRPTQMHVLAFADGERPTVLPRAKPSSLEEVREYLRLLFSDGGDAGAGFNISPREATRFSLKVFQYLTACEARRQEYENLSWWDYLGGDSYEPGVQKLVDSWPEALVAMDSKSSDARSHGNAFIQLVLDNLRPEGYRDGTLRGPTTEAWLKHWRRYLENQGVRFVHGRLEGFQVVAREDGEQTIWPQVTCFEPHYPRDQSDDAMLMPGYFVLAASADQAVQLARRYREVAQAAGLAAPEELSDLHRTGLIRDDDMNSAEPTSDFRHFAGIQYYFSEDIFYVDGHVYYPDSPWGVTSVSQARFWNDRTDWEHGFRGVVSAIVGIWNVPGVLIKKPAWECSPEEIAEEVWHQITSSVENKLKTNIQGTHRFRVGSRGRDGTIPDPLYWHLDQGLEWNEAERRYRNKSPFHIATPKSWAKRPGDLHAGYSVENGWVVCGMFTKTHTRIPTMEAANESGRHATNAIVTHTQQYCSRSARFRGTLCDIWNPEDHEIEDLRWFKDLDGKLHARGLPHILEILDTDRVLDGALRGGTADPLDPVNLARLVHRMASEWLEPLGKSLSNRS